MLCWHSYKISVHLEKLHILGYSDVPSSRFLKATFVSLHINRLRFHYIISFRYCSCYAPPQFHTDWPHIIILFIRTAPLKFLMLTLFITCLSMDCNVFFSNWICQFVGKVFFLQIDGTFLVVIATGEIKAFSQILCILNV